MFAVPVRKNSLYGISAVTFEVASRLKLHQISNFPGLSPVRTPLVSLQHSPNPLYVDGAVSPCEPLPHGVSRASAGGGTHGERGVDGRSEGQGAMPPGQGAMSPEAESKLA